MTESPLITLRGAPSKEQMLVIQYSFLKARYRTYFLVSWLLAGIFMGIGVAQLLATGRGGVIEPACVLGIYLGALPYWYRWLLRRRFEMPKNQSFFVPTIYEIDDSEIRMMSDGGSSAVTPWSVVIEVRRWPGGLLLMLSEFTFHIFYPERFATAEEWARFEEFAKRRPIGKPL